MKPKSACRKHLVSTIVLALSLGAASAHADVLLGLAADADARNGSTQTIVNLGSASLICGGSGSPAADRSSVLVFQFPNLGATSNPFTTASLSFNAQKGTSGIAPNFNADLYGIGARASSAVVVADYYGLSNTEDPTDAVRLQDNILTPANAPANGTPQVFTTSVDGNTALLNYLNAQYDSGAGIGKYVFLRFSTDGGTVGANKGYFITSNEGGAEGPPDTRPQIIFTTTPIDPPPVEIVKADNTSNLNLGASWVGGVAPATNEIAKWNATVTSANTCVAGAALTWAGIKIVDPAGPVSIDGGDSITLGSALVDIDMSNTIADLTLNAPLVLGAANVWDVASGFALSVNGGISGNQMISKIGLGAATLAGASLSSAGITLEQGILNVNQAAALGTGTFTLAGGTLDNTSGLPLVLTTNNPQAWTGPVGFTGSNNLDLGTGNVTMTATRNVSVTSGTLTVGGVISGNAGLNKLGNGTLALTGSSDFTGQIIMSGGGGSVVKATIIADAGQPSSLGAGTGTPSSVIRIGDVSSPGTLEYTGLSPVSTNRKVQVGSSNSGSGSATIINNNADPANTLTFTNATFNNAATGTPFGRSLNLGGSNTGINEIQGKILNNTLNGPTGGVISINKNNAGTWKLSGVNDYTGATSVNAGLLIIGSGAAIPDGVGAGSLKVNGTLDLNGASEAVNNLDGNGNGVIDSKVAGTPTLTVFSDLAQFTVFAGDIVNTAGSVSVAKTGPGQLTLSGTNTYSGTTTVSEGILAVDLGTAVPDSGSLVIDGGKVEVIADETVDTLYYGGVPQPFGTYGSTASGATNKNDSRFSDLGTGILTVLSTGPVIATPYDTWVALYQPGFTQNLPAQDQDGDGLTNRQEFAFGLDPKSGTSVNPIAVGLATGTGNFSYTRYASSGLNYKVWSSTDLLNWTDRTDTATQTPGTAGVNGTQTVAVTNLGATPVNGKLFVRVTAD